jgi:hypothetical protein
VKASRGMKMEQVVQALAEMKAVIRQHRKGRRPSIQESERRAGSLLR